MVLGIAYMVIGIYGYGYCARSNNLAIHLAYFALQIPLGAAIVYLGHGSGYNMLLLLPLAGHGVILLTTRWLYAVNLLIMISYSASVGLYSRSLTEIWAGLPTFIAGLIFIIVFTQMAVSEEKARNEVERLYEDLAGANQRLREYNLRLEELTITQERNRMAREIHDGLGHYLTTIHMQIQAGLAMLPGDIPKAKDALKIAQEQTQEALVDVRRSVASLREQVVDESLPLPDTLEKMLETCTTAGIVGQMKVLGTPRTLSPKVQHTFYRTAQESLNNIRKHSRAEHVWILLDYTQSNRIRLQVRDDGVGADHLDGGFGLIGIKERVTYLNGKVSTQTNLGQGFCLDVEIPV
jgi:signal transduction histidine kinase